MKVTRIGGGAERRRAEDDDKLVAKAQEHAKQVHQMDLTREQALAMARPE